MLARVEREEDLMSGRTPGVRQTNWIQWLLRVILALFGAWMLFMIVSGRVRRIGDSDRVPLSGGGGAGAPVTERAQP